MSLQTGNKWKNSNSHISCPGVDELEFQHFPKFILKRRLCECRGGNLDVDIFNDLNWRIIAQCIPFNSITNICRLCLEEKFRILFEPANASLNQRSEFFTTCRHKEDWLLVNR